MVDKQENKMAKTATDPNAPANETPAQRRVRRNAEAEAARKLQAEKEQKAREERAVFMRGDLFDLMVRLQKLHNAGFDVDVEVVVAASQQEVERSFEAGQPGLRVAFGSRHRSDGYRDEKVYTLYSEEWTFECLEDKIQAMQAEYDERQRQKALAAEAKKLLTPEQLAALKQYG
jgi:prolyl oligopeptidase PreP (S9A serine peptidase family)